jgi:hypothetical protein
MRYFNTAGPVVPEDHYCLPPLSRLDLENVLSLIDEKKYFVLHAPRQTGKTSCLMALVNRLNESDRYRALYANIESAQAAREDVAVGIRSVVEAIADAAEMSLGDSGAPSLALDVVLKSSPTFALVRFLSQWCRQSPKPTVLMLDEVDALVGDTLISLLRQLRSGYPNRPVGFPQSIILCGVRDVRDYRIHASSEKDIITGGSAFNIKAESLRLGDFSRKEMEQLYAQHSDETGQVFEADAISLAWDLSEGQPWLVNALAYETCFRMKEGRDRSRPITAESMEQAKENLILRRETHLDQLADKLREERVRRVIEPILVGESFDALFNEDDVQYTIDLGLVRRDPGGALTIANGIYQEIIPRALFFGTQMSITQQTAWYLNPAGRLDMPELLTAFQEFFREHSEHWVERFDYKEAGPQLLLQAFLQRIVNGGGRLEREYGLGRRRTDLLVQWPVGSTEILPGRPVQKIVLELKVTHGSPERAITEGLAQTADYMGRCGAGEGHLLIFDRRKNVPWEEKLYRREEQAGTHIIDVWGA